MKILIWSGHHDALDFFIKFLTHGKGCHAAFLRSDGQTIHEAFYPRVRDRNVTRDDRHKAECYELEGLTPADHEAFERLFDHHLKTGVEYSVLDLFRYAFNRPVRGEKHTFCSRYVMHCLQTVLHGRAMPLMRLPYRDWASPRDLRISARLIPVKWDRTDGTHTTDTTDADKRGVPGWVQES